MSKPDKTLKNAVKRASDILTDMCSLARETANGHSTSFWNRWTTMQLQKRLLKSRTRKMAADLKNPEPKTGHASTPLKNTEEGMSARKNPDAKRVGECYGAAHQNRKHPENSKPHGELPHEDARTGNAATRIQHKSMEKVPGARNDAFAR